jgi:hypothetical protein
MTATRLDRWRAHVLADPALQMNLARCETAGSFVAASGLPPGAFAGLLDPDPLGLAAFAPAPIRTTVWPGPDWRPSRVAGATVDWLHFAGAALDEPFYAQSLRRAAARPFNRLFRTGMSLADFLAGAPADAPAPAGFLFHMGRCGSTLAARLLGAASGLPLLSEPPPLDAAAAAGDPAMLRAMIAALAPAPAIVKLDSRHALLLPLYRAAFPAVPWLFVHRDPVEVLVSLEREPLSPLAGVPAGEDARLLGAICAAAVAGLAAGGGLAVDYRDLPGALAAMLAHLGLAAGGADLTALAARDAKRPAEPFAGDAAAKQAAASPAIRAAAAAHVAPIYARLAPML